MSILRHTRHPGISIYEWCNSFSPLIKSYLRISQSDDLRSIIVSTNASPPRSRILSNPFWHRPTTNGNHSLSLRALLIWMSSRRTYRQQMQISPPGNTSQLLSFWSTLFLGQLNKMSQPLLLLLRNPTQEKLSEVQLRTANALRSDFKEAGNGSSTTWSTICGMMIL
jgi:hypothetical protein